MKLVYENIGHILCFNKGYVNELVVENKKLFLEMVNDIVAQADGGNGKFVLSIADRVVELSRHVDITVQFVPFELNRKSLLTKLYSTLEQKALYSEDYIKSREILNELEKFIYRLAEEIPFEICCKRVAIGPVIRALSPEIDDNEKTTIEKIFAYMETVRELDRDRIFIMVNMRTYFSDEEMECFIESVCLHDFKLLLIESVSFAKLQNTLRYTVDEDLCEF